MTHRERIISLKETIVFLYEKEGRSKSYISRLLKVDRKVLTEMINKEWELKQANISYLTPSNQKFLNKHKQLIKSRLDNNISVINIAKELNVDRHYIYRIIIKKDEVLFKAYQDYVVRRDNTILEKREEQKNASSLNYNFEKIEGEEWKEILGHEEYYISNLGRVKKYTKTYDDYFLLETQENIKNGRVYVWIGKQGLQVSRLVGFAFLDNHSEINNTINHKDGNVLNNSVENLEWVSQSQNNRHSYQELKRTTVKPSQKHKKFKKIILNDKYEFKTISALASFIGKSESQTHRYINNEIKDNPYKIDFIY